MMENKIVANNGSSIVIYTTDDGNKRIASMLFLWFMEKNGILYGQDGHKRIADNTLVNVKSVRSPRVLPHAPFRGLRPRGRITW